MNVSYEQARAIVDAALVHGRAQGYKPLTVAVPPGPRPPPPRAPRAPDSPEFFTSVATLTGGKVFSVPGGVFITDAEGTVLGAAGASGDASLADEDAVVAGVEAAGLVARTGA